MNRLLVLAGVVLSGLFAKGQELNCQVTIIADAKLEVTSVELEIFKELEQAVFDIMNNTKWTKHEFEVEERINCNLQFQINEIPSSGNYKGWLQIQSTRPGLNSNYNTTVFNYQDEDVQFTYQRGAPIRVSETQFVDNLSSILAFYAYFIIGMDYDTFSQKGGTDYFIKAQDIVNNAQVASFSGWKSNQSGKRNRYWLVDNILHELFSPLRECSYEYHRKGIDVLYDDQVAGRKAIYNALNRLMKVVATRPNSLNLLNFVQAKSNELKNLFQNAEAREKNDIVNLLKRVDPANSSKYQEIMN